VANRSGERVEKPWGHELIWAHAERYVGKLIVIEPGHKLSLQYHEKKDESILVLKGTLRLHHGKTQESVEATDLPPGRFAHISTGDVHRFEALDERVELVEVSTTELDDVVRLEDDYDRQGTSEA
jgi:mannose-6-phosphate isomerase